MFLRPQDHSKASGRRSVCRALGGQAPAPNWASNPEIFRFALVRPDVAVLSRLPQSCGSGADAEVANKRLRWIVIAAVAGGCGRWRRVGCAPRPGGISELASLTQLPRAIPVRVEPPHGRPWPLPEFVTLWVRRPSRCLIDPLAGTACAATSVVAHIL